MTGDFIGFNEDTLTFKSEEPKDVGDEIVYELCMPEGILLRQLTLNGIVKKCKYLHGQGSIGYILEVTVSNMTDENRLILDAYMEFLKREEGLNSISIDQKALQEAFETFGEKFVELYKESVQLLKNLKGEDTIH